MMRRGARLHRHHARRQLGEKRDELAAREFARHNDLAPRVDGVNLKYPLRQIETNPRDGRQIPDRLAHGRLPFRWGFDNDHLGTLMPFGAVAVGTAIAGRPPHRSRRAAVTPRAPTSGVGRETDVRATDAGCADTAGNDWRLPSFAAMPADASVPVA